MHETIDKISHVIRWSEGLLTVHRPPSGQLVRDGRVLAWAPVGRRHRLCLDGRPLIEWSTEDRLWAHPHLDDLLDDLLGV